MLLSSFFEFGRAELALRPVTEAWNELPNDRERQRTIATQVLIDASRLQMPPPRSVYTFALLVETELGCLDRIRHVDREMRFFIGCPNRWENFG